MQRRYELTGETKVKYGRTLHRVQWMADNREGGWITDEKHLPQDGAGVLYDDAEIYGGIIRGGTIYGGIIRGGIIEGGTIYGGIIRGGTIYGGTIYGGIIRGGTIYGGIIRGGTIYGGTIEGGIFYTSPCQATRRDGYVFTAKIINGDLRIWAGCRNFSWDDAVDHWNDHHIHGAETQRIIDFLRAQAEAEAERDAKRKQND